MNINELPLSIRFSIDNTILAGLSVGEEKPNIDYFFNPIVIQLKKLELGFNLSIDNQDRETKCFLIAAIFDKPAKSAVLNINGCNGFYGCHVCYQPGISYREQGGRIHIYEFQPKDSKDWTNARTHENYLSDLNDVKSTGKMVNGIKGACILGSLKHFKPLANTCVDLMHSGLEEVGKKFFNLWFSSENSSHPSRQAKRKSHKNCSVKQHYKRA